MDGLPLFPIFGAVFIVIDPADIYHVIKSSNKD